MIILGHNWFELAKQKLDKSQWEILNNWTGTHHIAFGLGIFIWILVILGSILFIFLMYWFISGYLWEKVIKIKENKNQDKLDLEYLEQSEYEHFNTFNFKKKCNVCDKKQNRLCVNVNNALICHKCIDYVSEKQRKLKKWGQ